MNRNIILCVAGLLAPVIMVVLLISVMHIYEWLTEYPPLFLIAYVFLSWKLIGIQKKGSGL